ncbi:hypothetical protein AB6A40_004332 [Gnathostoma spinigerum]|uniref:Uncharacterized protein n=1 Tax=Gnathostoma spinigerum TaxID=75299 RepID=A0ABD6EKY7_9BILA
MPHKGCLICSLSEIPCVSSSYPVKSEASTSSGERSESDTESELSQHLTRRRRRVTKPRRKRSSVDLSSHINLQPCREGISSPLLTAERNSSASEDRCESVVEHPTRPESLTVNMGGDPDEVDESLAEEDQQSLSKCATKKLKTSETPPLLLANERCVAETDETTGKPVIMEVSGYKQNASPLMRYDDRKNSTYSSSGEMPRLRLSTVGGGGDIVNDDEDEEAPPRLSPNFASVCFSDSELLDENSLSENDIAPELAETAGSPQPNRSKHAATYSESSDYVNTSVAEISRSSAQSVVQNPCEMVNVGGDAGSEGDSETGETGVTVPKKSEECSGNVCVTTTLEDEPSVLDRPPKAPAMLLQPAEDHDIHATPSYDQNLYLKGGREMLPGDSSTSYLETLQSSISPPSALSCASNISSKQSNVGSQEIAQHQQQMDTSVGGSDTSGTFLNTSGSLNSTPSTPIRLSNPQQGGQTSSNGGTNFGSPPGGQPVEMQIRVHNQRTVNSQLAASSVDIASAPSTLQRITRSPAHQSQRRNSGKKEHGRSTKSSTSSIPSRTHLSQMSSGQVPIAPYMLGAPGVPHTMTNPDITDSHSSQQAPGPYYHTNYSHAASSSHFDTQFYSAGWAGTGYPGSVASGYPSHMSAVAKTAMPNGFGYPYPSGILQPSNGMMGAIPIPNTASSASASVTCQVMNTQGNRMNTSHPGNPPAAWRYVSNPSTTLSGSGFMDAFSSGMTSSATGNQFPIPNQIYPQSYYPYLTPVMRNE